MSMIQVHDSLYLGSFRDAENIAGLQAAGISAVVNVAASDTFPAGDIMKRHGEHHIDSHRVGLIDGAGNTISMFQAAVLTVIGQIELGRKVLVHCHAGQSRSPSVVAAIMAIKAGGTVEQHLNALSKMRSVVDPNSHVIMLAEQFVAQATGNNDLAAAIGAKRR